MSNFEDFMIGEATKQNQAIDDLRKQRNALRAALGVILDAADYTAGNCRVNEMVGAVLPKEVLTKAREAYSAKLD